MIVDDEPAIVKMVSKTLESEGYHIQTASDGIQALELFKKEPCNVIITDIQMPNMDGITLLHNVKKLDLDVEVIIMTGVASIENALETLRQNGAFDFFRKSIDGMNKLVITVEQALTKQRLDLQNRQLVKSLTKERTMSRVAFDSISDPIIMLNFKMILIGANRAALTDSGIKEFSECIGKKCYKVFGKTESYCRGCQIIEHLYTKKTIRFKRQGIKNPEKIENITIYPSTDTKKRLGILVKIQDVTHQIEIDEQMTRADRLASLGQLSGGIAHEIRNPLAGIKLFLDILDDEKRFERSENEKECIDEINININKIDGIIKRVLTFSNPAESQLANLDINQLIIESLKLFSSKLKKTNIIHKLYLEKSIPQVKGDYIGLQQVITNLTLNAIETMEDMGGTLSIRTFKKNHSSSTGEAVFIEVKDTGEGIITEKQEYIFNPFFTTKPNGTGLGLSISYQIVERHKGRLSFKSFPGKDTSFTIELPAAKEI